MSKTNLREVCFTPVIDSIAEEHGLITALVFGRVWRYCQMEKGLCTAAQEKIAKDLHVSLKTIQRHLKTLVKEGYLIDLTPELKNYPHTYQDTGKPNFTRSESPSAKSQSLSAKSESPSHWVTESQHAKSQSPMKIVLREEEERIKETENSFSFESQNLKSQNQEQEQNLSLSKEEELISGIKKDADALNADALTRKDINELFERELFINIGGQKWDSLAALALSRGKDATSRFIKYWKENGGEPRYWSAERMEAFFPQAYVEIKPLVELALREEVKVDKFVGNWVKHL